MRSRGHFAHPKVRSLSAGRVGGRFGRRGLLLARGFGGRGRLLLRRVRLCRLGSPLGGGTLGLRLRVGATRDDVVDLPDLDLDGAEAPHDATSSVERILAAHQPELDLLGLRGVVDELVSARICIRRVVNHRVLHGLGDGCDDVVLVVGEFVVLDHLEGDLGYLRIRLVDAIHDGLGGEQGLGDAGLSLVVREALGEHGGRRGVVVAHGDSLRVEQSERFGQVLLQSYETRCVLEQCANILA